MSLETRHFWPWGLECWIWRTLHDFARDSLKPTALAAVAMGNLERGLTKPLGADRTRAALGELTMGVRPDAEADLPGAVRDLASGRLDRAIPHPPRSPAL